MCIQYFVPVAFITSFDKRNLFSFAGLGSAVSMPNASNPFAKAWAQSDRSPDAPGRPPEPRQEHQQPDSAGDGPVGELGGDGDGPEDMERAVHGSGPVRVAELQWFLNCLDRELRNSSQGFRQPATRDTAAARNRALQPCPLANYPGIRIGKNRAPN